LSGVLAALWTGVFTITGPSVDADWQLDIGSDAGVPVLMNNRVIFERSAWGPGAVRTVDVTWGGSARDLFWAAQWRTDLPAHDPVQAPAGSALSSWTRDHGAWRCGQDYRHVVCVDALGFATGFWRRSGDPRWTARLAASSSTRPMVARGHVVLHDASEHTLTAYADRDLR